MKKILISLVMGMLALTTQNGFADTQINVIVDNQTSQNHALICKIGSFKKADFIDRVPLPAKALTTVPPITQGVGLGEYVRCWAAGYDLYGSGWAKIPPFKSTCDLKFILREEKMGVNRGGRTFFENFPVMHVDSDC